MKWGVAALLRGRMGGMYFGRDLGWEGHCEDGFLFFAPRFSEICCRASFLFASVFSLMFFDDESNM